MKPFVLQYVYNLEKIILRIGGTKEKKGREEGVGRGREELYPFQEGRVRLFPLSQRPKPVQNLPILFHINRCLARLIHVK